MFYSIPVSRTHEACSCQPPFKSGVVCHQEAVLCLSFLLPPPAKAALEKRVEQLEKDHQELLNENIRITEDSHSLVSMCVWTVCVRVCVGGVISVCVGVMWAFSQV